VILGSVLGIALAVTGFDLPQFVAAPLSLIAGMAVPGALIAFGISLRGAPLPGRGGRAGDVIAVVAIKVVLMPFVAFALARFVFGMGGVPLLAATMCAALPTAQNVFVYAMRYRTAVPLARDVVSTTTVACIPALVVIAAVLS